MNETEAYILRSCYSSLKTLLNFLMETSYKRFDILSILFDLLNILSSYFHIDLPLQHTRSLKTYKKFVQ